MIWFAIDFIGYEKLWMQVSLYLLLAFDASSPSDLEFLEVLFQTPSDSYILEKCEAESWEKEEILRVSHLNSDIFG
jgi:hypothetical protein